MNFFGFRFQNKLVTLISSGLKGLKSSLRPKILKKLPIRNCRNSFDVFVHDFRLLRLLRHTVPFPSSTMRSFTERYLTKRPRKKTPVILSPEEVQAIVRFMEWPAAIVVAVLPQSFSIQERRSSTSEKLWYIAVYTL